ncbi:hypothetical protein KIPB_003055 [Kipferlia bialata]|uniref:Uncharacterized protein n=1 Tax=Kipferlia bialata TaxID=797122 RepID=A0A9K3CTC8_9EUKA|nr:hypothetical protein KIPB_003055 [Kipferlia bialata]|eukprot:g3055.t1
MGDGFDMMGSGFECDYVSAEYVDIDDTTLLTAASGTIDNSNYYNGQNSRWIVAHWGATSASITCEGETSPGDMVKLFTASCDGTLNVNHASLLASSTGVIDIDEEMHYGHDQANCFYVEFETDLDYVGGQGFNCTYYTSDGWYSWD